VCVGLYLGVGHGFWPRADERIFVQYAFVASLGYGHLVGCGWSSLRRNAALHGSTSRVAILRIANLMVAAGVCLAVYSGGLHASVQALWPLLAILLWHVAENEAALPRLCRDPRAVVHGREQPQALALALAIALLALAVAGVEEGSGLPRWLVSNQRAVSTHAGGAGALVFILAGIAARLRGRSASMWFVAAALCGGVAGFGPRLAGFLSFGDVSTGVVLYHLMSWLFLMGSRAAAHRRVGRREGLRAVRLLVVSHAAPWLLCGAAVFWGPTGGGATSALLLAPGIYLFWSALHTLHTAYERGVGVKDGARDAFAAPPAAAPGDSSCLRC